MSAHLAAPETATWLPSPPNDEEKYWYLGRQHRWLPVCQAASFALIAISILKFSTSDPRFGFVLVPLALYIVTLTVSLISSTRPRRMDRIGHEARVNLWEPYAGHPYPSIDVFLPSAGEDLDILANTYAHVAQLNWPGPVTVYVLDDSGRATVQDMAHEFGFTYLSRPDRGHLKKAGNLRYGYEHSDGDFILILDADFVPRRDALHELVPYFDDAYVGIVQSPQFFDTDPKMGWLQRCAGATQELFYRFIQPSRDRRNAAICVGTCALYRRSALIDAGGFAQIGHSEDVHTGVNLMKAGYVVRYVPILVAKGLCPDTLSGFVNQQYRWCTGSMSLLADPNFHQRVGARQRLCFWAGFLYYISTAVNVVVAPWAALIMFYAKPSWVEPMNSIWLLGALALWFLVLPRVMHGRWRIDVLRVQALYSVSHLIAIAHIFLGRTAEWVATGAANRRTNNLALTISRFAKGYFATVYAIIWLGVIHGVMTYGIEHWWAAVGLSALGSYIHLPIVLEPIQGRAQPEPVALTPAPPTLLPWLDSLEGASR